MKEVKIVNGFRRTCKFGPRIHPITKEVQMHNGIDFVGSDYALLAIADGVIIDVGQDPLSGNFIKVEHVIDGDTFVLSYCHVSRFLPSLKGYKVEAGEWIITMGNSGRSTGIHCHLTVRRNGEIVNPELYFKFI